MKHSDCKEFQEISSVWFYRNTDFLCYSGRAKNPEFFTTGQTFGDQLHSYTIVDAINDKNVLPFRVDYIKTMDVEEEISDEMVWPVVKNSGFLALPELTEKIGVPVNPNRLYFLKKGQLKAILRLLY